jgi:hypothetical protein
MTSDLAAAVCKVCAFARRLKVWEFRQYSAGAYFVAIVYKDGKPLVEGRVNGELLDVIAANCGFFR